MGDWGYHPDGRAQADDIASVEAPVPAPAASGK
jgi:hypothetical protein